MKEETWKSYNRYIGYDWAELCKTFNVPMCREHSDGDIECQYGVEAEYNMSYGDSYHLRAYLEGVIRGDSTLVRTFAVRECRKFVGRLVKRDQTDYGFVYRGLNKARSDFVFMQLFIEMLPLLWT